MARKHGKEAVRARQSRAADEIAKLAMNPEVAAAIDAIQAHADKDFAAGERLFDKNQGARRVSSYPLRPHRVLRRHGLVAHVLPDKAGRPRVSLSLIGSLHHESRLIQIPAQDLLGASPDADGPAKWVTLVVKRGQPLSTMVEEFEAVYRSVGNPARGASRKRSTGTLARAVDIYNARCDGEPSSRIAERYGLKISSVERIERHLRKTANLPRPSPAIARIRAPQGTECQECANGPCPECPWLLETLSDMDAVEGKQAHRL